MKSLRINSVVSSSRLLAVMLGGLLCAGGFIVGYKPHLSASDLGELGIPRSSSREKQATASSECGFVVRSIITDLAEQIYFAAKKGLPDTNTFSVFVTEASRSTPEATAFEIRIRLGANEKEMESVLAVNGPLWSPQLYQDVARQMAKMVGLGLGQTGQVNTFFLGRMKGLNVDEIVRADRSVSGKLEKDFSNPQSHEEAAVVLGFFALRDHSGKFFDLRSPLSRIATHLTMAQLLRGTKEFDVNGQVAEAIMLTVSGNQVAALECLEQIATRFPDQLPVVRALRARNTGDYRTLDKLTDLSPIESTELFRARAHSVGVTLAWNKLSNENRASVDYVRIANETDYSVGIGHKLYDFSIPLEFREAALAYSMIFQKQISSDRVSFNDLPKNCLIADGNKARVEVVGWGQWAYFFQRHLCHAIEQNFSFLQSAWGVPNQATAFATKCEQDYGNFRLYPFVQRFTATDEVFYRKAVDAALRVATTAPQFVPVTSWNYLFYQSENWPAYRSKVDSRTKDWFRHAPLPGTVYDFSARLGHPTLVQRQDAIAHLAKLTEMAPYNDLLIRFFLHRKYQNHPSQDQVAKAYEAILPYHLDAMIAVANTLQDKPAEYEELMLKAAGLNSDCYYLLSDLKIKQGREDHAARYLDLACTNDLDSVQVANHALWRVKYLLKKGRKAEAQGIADHAGRVYSAIGLEAKAFYFEATENYNGAFEWYYKILERYDDAEPLNEFRKRYKSRTNDTRFDSVAEAHARTLFPNGQQKVNLKDFQAAPTGGTLIDGQSQLLRAAGIQPGAVIVALNGIRTQNLAQYTYVRDHLLTDPEMNLIVWQNGGYQQITASPPNYKFNVSIRDYTK